MMEVDNHLRDLADELRDARGRILSGWQAAVAQDPLLTTAPTISRTQLAHVFAGAAVAPSGRQSGDASY